MPRKPAVEFHYTVAQMAALLQVHPKTIERACTAGEILHRQIGDLKRIPESEAKDYLERVTLGKGNS